MEGKIMNQALIEELIKRLEIRQKQLTGELNLGYALHSGHHLRDVFTVLAVLKDNPKAEQLVENLPRRS